MKEWEEEEEEEERVVWVKKISPAARCIRRNDKMGKLMKDEKIIEQVMTRIRKEHL